MDFSLQVTRSGCQAAAAPKGGRCPGELGHDAPAAQHVSESIISENLLCGVQFIAIELPPAGTRSAYGGGKSA